MSATKHPLLKNILPAAVIITATSFLAICAGCSRNNAGSAGGETLYVPGYASGFRIDTLENGITELLVRDSWQGADTAFGHALMILPADSKQKKPSGYTGQVITGPAQRIVAMSSTHVAMLDAIGCRDRIVAVSGKDYIFNRDVSKNTEIADVGNQDNADIETLVASKPDLVMLYGITSESRMQARLEELGIPYVYIGDYTEQTPVGKAEWLVALAHICGVRDAGAASFNKIPEAYDAVRNAVADAGLPKTKVMFNTPYADSWVLPAAESYQLRLIADAGGEPVYEPSDGNTSTAISMEDAYLLTDKADVWLNLGLATKMSDVKTLAPKLMTTRPVRTGRVYNSNRRITRAGGSDYYESAVINPHIVLKDLAAILHPGLFGDYKPVYYRKLD